MNLKLEDLESEFNNRNLFEKNSDSSEKSVSDIKVGKNNLILRSMKDALEAMKEDPQETSRSEVKKA